MDRGFALRMGVQGPGIPFPGHRQPPPQLPAVLCPGLTVVVTPLLSLMQDQVQALCSLACGGVPASYLSSQQGVVETRVCWGEGG